MSTASRVADLQALIHASMEKLQRGARRLKAAGPGGDVVSDSSSSEDEEDRIEAPIADLFPDEDLAAPSAQAQRRHVAQLLAPRREFGRAIQRQRAARTAAGFSSVFDGARFASLRSLRLCAPTRFAPRSLGHLPTTRRSVCSAGGAHPSAAQGSLARGVVGPQGAPD
jgi:hypothetical protein